MWRSQRREPRGVSAHAQDARTCPYTLRKLGSPERLSRLEIREQAPELGRRLRDHGRTAAVLAALGPRDVGTKALAHAATARVGRMDAGLAECEPPRGGLLLQARAGAAGADEVSDLVQGDEVGHLPAH